MLGRDLPTPAQHQQSTPGIFYPLVLERAQDKQLEKRGCKCDKERKKKWTNKTTQKQAFIMWTWTSLFEYTVQCRRNLLSVEEGFLSRLCQEILYQVFLSNE